MKRKRLAISVGLVAVVVFLFSLPTLLRSQYWTHVLILSTIWVLMTVSLRCLTRVGQISMGSAGFMLVGAYTSALLSMKAGVNVWLTLLLGGLLAAVIAFAASFPFLRAKGVYFAILTVMLAEVLRLIVFYWSKLTGGYSGLAEHPGPGTHPATGSGRRSASIPRRTTTTWCW